jgi:glycerol kinase
LDLRALQGIKHLRKSGADPPMRYILALDAGTTSVRAILFDHSGQISAVAQREIRQIYPQPGWVEHDPEEIWSSQVAVAMEALGSVHASASEVAGIGITNQRETAIVWDRESGEPVYNAIVWQDRRTAGMCDELRRRGALKTIQKRTGLLLDSYFSATKVTWILENVAGARKKAEQGKLAFGTVDSWLAWKLTSRTKHITDVSNASRTLLFNIHKGEWDPELLKLFRVPACLLPEVRSSSEVYGLVSSTIGLQDIPISGIAGDQQAALFGQMCVRPGGTKSTYGTGCFLLQNTGAKAVNSKNRLLTTIAWKIGRKTDYAQEGSVFIGGAVVQWLRDGLKLVRSAAEINELAGTVKDSGGLYLVPAFAGLGAPHWDAYARGLLIGITRDTSAGHLARAALEGVAFQVADLLDAMQSDTGKKLKELRVDGGFTKSDLSMQFQADILGIPIIRPAVTETTALGAAYLAGLAVAFWKDINSIASQWKVDKQFEPKMRSSEADERRTRWRQALARAKEWELPVKADKRRKRYR